MDMKKYLRRWLNGAELRRLNNRYEGIIEAVDEEPIRNPFTYVKQYEPVIRFEDGYRLIPNVTMRRTLIEFWGRNTDDWIGQRLIVFQQPIERVDQTTGKTLTRWEKRVMREVEDIARRRRAANE